MSEKPWTSEEMLERSEDIAAECIEIAADDSVPMQIVLAEASVLRALAAILACLERIEAKLEAKP